MAISKRLRYEILRRDNHTCRYCGAAAPDATLTIDHVIPTALGGSDKSDNLVAACKDCNAGKTSSNPDAPLVDEVADDAVRWSKAIAAAGAEMLAELKERDDLHQQFADAWNAWTYGPENNRKHIPIDPSWRESVDALLAAGLPMPALLECINTAMTRKSVKHENRFRYMCGVAWRKVEKIRERAGKIIEAPDDPNGASEEGGDNEEDQQERAFFAHLGSVWSWARFHSGAHVSREEMDQFSDILISVLAFKDATGDNPDLTGAAFNCGFDGAVNLWDYIQWDSIPTDSDEEERPQAPVSVRALVDEALEEFFDDEERESYLDGVGAEHDGEPEVVIRYLALKKGLDDLAIDRGVLRQALNRLLQCYPQAEVDQYMDASFEAHRDSLGSDFTMASVASYAVDLMTEPARARELLSTLPEDEREQWLASSRKQLPADATDDAVAVEAAHQYRESQHPVPDGQPPF